MQFPTRFEGLRDLARLPWFSLRDGRLVVDDPSVGVAIDAHTHLSLAFVRPNQLDLERAWPETEHYLPAARALDLDVYQNRNFSQDDLRAMRRDLSLGALTAGGMRRTHTVANLTREMGELRIVQSVLLAIDMPALSQNALDWLKAARGHDEIIVFGSVHPYARHVEQKLDAQVALGARGIKVHPAVQLVRADDGRAMKLYAMCGRRGIPVFWHCGPVDIEPPLGRYLSQVRFYEQAIAENPDTIFVMGHSGALQMETALGFAKRYPNAWLELASQSLSNIRALIERGPRDRIVFGTDWPFYHQATGLAKVFIATEGDPATRHAVLYGNLARLLGLKSREVGGG